MQDEEKKREDEEPSLNVEASLTINRGYKLPLAKLSVSGSIQENEDQMSSVVQRSVLFVIDRSGSMVHLYFLRQFLSSLIPTC